MSLYIFCCILPQVLCGIGIVLSSKVAPKANLSVSRELAGRGKDFIAPGKRRCFPEHGCNGTVFFLAELDGVLYGRVVELAAKAIEQFQLDPHRGRLRGALAGTNDFQRFELLPFLFQDAYNVRGSASSQ